MLTTWHVVWRALRKGTLKSRACAVPRGSGAVFAVTAHDRMAPTPPIARHAPPAGFAPFAMRFAFVFAFVSASAACSKAYIPNTDLENTSQNREVIGFCEQYRHALEDKNVVQILKLMSPSYFEDSGNTRTDDDADYDKIREFLTGDFLKTSGIRYEIRYHRVTFSETNHIYVDYTFAASWKLPGIKADEWRHKVADNRLDLVRDGESFKIVAGM
jgi:hypothetical protein